MKLTIGSMTVMLGLTLVFMSFQNCSHEVSFYSESAGSLASKESLVAVQPPNDPPVAGDQVSSDQTHTEYPSPGDVGSEVGHNGNGNGNQAHQDHSSGSDSNSNDSSNDSGDDSSDHVCTNPDHHHEVVDSEHGDHEGSEYVACILDGPGKSLKLGIVSQSLDGVNAAASVVCVTEKACLGPVAEVFKVKGAYERGYCEHHQNARRLSDDEVKSLLPAPVASAQ